MRLQEGCINSTYTVSGINLPLKLRRRLEALGLTEGTDIVVLNKKGCGAVVVKFRGTRFALGWGIAKKIRIERRL